MKLITDNKTYDDVLFYPSTDGCTITAAAPIELGDTLTLQADDGVMLREYVVAHYLRCVVDGNTLRLTNTPEPEAVEPDLNALKIAKIAETKTALETYLAEHPIQWTDSKYYSVTSEKQTLLNNALAVYQIAVSVGQTPELTWNATGEECVEWAYADLCALALGIAAFVKPLVSHQQTLEVAIRAASTVDEINAVVIDYASGN